MQRLKGILFLVLFLVSQASFSLDLHYCHEELTDIAFFGNSSCACVQEHHHDHENGCPKHQKESNNTTKVNKPCCSTDQVKVEKASDLVTPGKITLMHINAVQTNCVCTHCAFIPKKVNQLPEEYITPLSKVDRRILIQSFQI